MTVAAPTKIAYTVAEAAAAIGVSRRKLFYMIKAGELPSVMSCGRRLIRADALQALLN